MLSVSYWSSLYRFVILTNTYPSHDDGTVTGPVLATTVFSPADPNTSFGGKTVIVTGANRGLGFEAALKFMALDASRVILGVRDPIKGVTAKTTLEQMTGREGVVEIWELDMDSYDSIQDFARRAGSLHRLDVVVLNAGVLMYEHKESLYGWEQSLQTNVLSTALLALLLLPLLKNASELASEDHGRPVLQFVSSGTYKHAVIAEEHRDMDNLFGYHSSDTQDFDGNNQYAVSKLFVMYVMQTLASIARSGNQATSDLWGSSLIQSSRLSPLTSGRLGEELRKKIWSEVLEALAKDLPNLAGILDRAGAVEVP
ncbi:oxidoreductase-short chain dehydrogenase [Apiospora rasikravindrae]|uniref:Oxidoreductase-short chain dehydrogenase n=1 Tax=Apiospora rasikravindrae TaxID=990691 RepID=A0ABR1RT14_9PEZI